MTMSLAMTAAVTSIAAVAGTEAGIMTGIGITIVSAAKRE
jgi:hypothetical protein